MKIINLPRSGGKTKLMAEWVLKNTHKRGVLVGTKQQQVRLKQYEVPEQNIILTTSNKALYDISRFAEVGVDELPQVLDVLLKGKLQIATLTANGEIDD